MKADKKESIGLPFFTCCQDQTNQVKTVDANNIPSKILYQTRTTDPKSDLKGNHSSNLLQITPDSPNNVKQQAKMVAKRSIRQKKGKDDLKNEFKSPQNEHKEDEKILFNKESHHQTKVCKLQNKPGQWSSNKPVQQLTIYDSDHVKVSSKPEQFLLSSPQRESGFNMLKIDKRSCVASAQDQTPTAQKNQNGKNKKISINTHLSITQNQQKYDSTIAIPKSERQVSQFAGPQQHSSSNNTSINKLQVKLKDSLDIPQHNNAQFYQSTNQNSFKFPQIYIIKAISVPTTPEGKYKKDSFRPFLSGNNQGARNMVLNNQTIEQSKDVHTDLPTSKHNFISPNPTLIESKIERSLNDNQNPQSARNLACFPTENKRSGLKTPRKSDLEMLKASCVSEIDGNQEDNLKKDNSYFIKVNAINTSNMDSDKQKSSNLASVKNSFNTNKSLVSKLGASKMSKMSSYQLKMAGLGSISVNSFAESISQSKINQKIQESVVMQDFFNPAKTLFSKWGKGQNEQNPDEAQEGER